MKHQNIREIVRDPIRGAAGYVASKCASPNKVPSRTNLGLILPAAFRNDVGLLYQFLQFYKESTGAYSMILYPIFQRKCHYSVKDITIH
jgi:hypothetical protein